METHLAQDLDRKKPCDNDVQSDSFESHLDNYFRSDSKEKEAWMTRRSFIKYEGKWA